MRTEFRFPKATAWLMPVIFAAIVMAVEKAKSIQASYSGARPPGVIPPSMHFSFLLIILLIVILIFGANRLPGLAKAMGSTIKNFKEGVKDDSADHKS